ncbi:hypothetical protein BH09PAT2_BH09PAT2_02720 [soil metagenome]
MKPSRVFLFLVIAAIAAVVAFAQGTQKVHASDQPQTPLAAPAATATPQAITLEVPPEVTVNAVSNIATYEAVITNNGSTAVEDVTFTVSGVGNPDVLSVSSSNASCTSGQGGKLIQCPLGKILPNQSIPVSVSVKLADSGNDGSVIQTVEGLLQKTVVHQNIISIFLPFIRRH